MALHVAEIGRGRRENDGTRGKDHKCVSSDSLVHWIRAAGLTQKEIAETLGVTERQVKYDLAPDDKKGNSAPFAHEDIIDAEIIEEDEPVNHETGEQVAFGTRDECVKAALIPNACCLPREMFWF